MAQMPTYRWLRLQLTKPFLFYRLASTLPRQNGTCLTSSTAGPYSLQLAQIMYTLRKIWLRNFFRFLRPIKCLTDIFFSFFHMQRKSHVEKLRIASRFQLHNKGFLFRRFCCKWCFEKCRLFFREFSSTAYTYFMTDYDTAWIHYEGCEFLALIIHWALNVT